VAGADRTTIEEVGKVLLDEHADVIREAVKAVAAEMMELEVFELIGPEHGERRPADRATHRNGYRPRRCYTRAGEIEQELQGTCRWRCERSPGSSVHDDLLIQLDEAVVKSLSRAPTPRMTSAWRGPSSASSAGTARRSDPRSWPPRCPVGACHPYMLVAASRRQASCRCSTSHALSPRVRLKPQDPDQTRRSPDGQASRLIAGTPFCRPRSSGALGCRPALLGRR
jgi:hypothetical protein